MSKAYKALCVLEPSGDMIARGKKSIEVRGSRTGEVAPGEDLLIVQSKAGLADTKDPIGRAVALVCLKEIRPFVYADRAEAKTERFEEALWAWVLTNPRRLSGRVRVPVAPGVFEVVVNAEELV